MDSSSLCLTCGQTPRKSIVISDPSKQDIALIICQHFWYQEDDLRSAIICTLCWDKVDGFHRFYQEAKQLHEQQLSLKPSAVFIKQEIEIEEPELQENVQSEEAQGEQVADEAECRFEITEIKEECGQSDSSSQKAHSSKKKVKRTEVTPEQEKAEDDFIKQHRPYVCSDCYEEFESFEAIRRHTYVEHKKRYIMCCGTQQRSRSVLYQHVQHVLNPDAIRCEICDKTFKFHSGYIRHMEELHPEGKTLIFKCDRCPRSFPKKKLLKRHLSEHETLENETAKCEICGKCFARRILLKRHILAVHVEKRYDFICELCSRRFATISELRKHKRVHDLTAEQLRKQCPVCNKWLKSVTSWRTHVQSHRDEGEFRCGSCDHVSVNQVALKRHIERMHSGAVRSYPCTLCGKEYSRPTTLKEHIANVHTGEPLYQCTYCEKKFFSNATMYRHKKKDHPQEWLDNHMKKYNTEAAVKIEGETGEGQ
ncbi:transcription factor grauzone [Aedes albopictus]|uniref:C2H2-type domain-containing protein n=1 Tax=Aedes albopictus TaxID=7160 RepID=A0ABM1YQV8_AEDAL|nr:transcription factor grauzone [Aedes albopictus]